MVSPSSSKHLFYRLLAARSFPSRVLCCSSSFSFHLLTPLLHLPPTFAPIRRVGVSPLVSYRFYNRAFFCTRFSEFEEEQGPAAIDYRTLVSEEEFHRLADSTLCDLQEKFEEFCDSIQSDGIDIDFGNQVLTMKLGNFGTYVINKQTPNRQIWLSSPVSGPSRFDWDKTHKAWVYRRTKATLLSLLEDEVGSFFGKPISLS